MLGEIVHQAVTFANITLAPLDVPDCVTGVDLTLFSSFIYRLSNNIIPASPFPIHILYSMQEAIPYKSHMAATAGGRSPLHNSPEGADNGGGRRLVTNGSETSVRKLVVENAVIVFGRRGCCMSHVVNRLLLGLGVNPAVCEVDEEKEEAVLNELSITNGGGVQFPVVFMGGKLFGGLDRVMSTHITGELVPILKEAGALWL